MSEDEDTFMRKIALKEYEFAEKLRNDYFKHSWVSTSIFIPICIGIIAASYTKELIDLPGIKLIPLFLSSLSIYVIWYWYTYRYAGYLKIIYSRFHYLENVLDMYLHTKICHEDRARKYSLKYLKIVFLILLIVLWLFRLGIPNFGFNLFNDC